MTTTHTINQLPTNHKVEGSEELQLLEGGRRLAVRGGGLCRRAGVRLCMCKLKGTEPLIALYYTLSNTYTIQHLPPPPPKLACRRWRMDQTMGKRMAQQHAMSTRWKMSRQVSHRREPGEVWLSSSSTTMAMLSMT